MIPLKSKNEIEIMQENGSILANVLEGVKLLAKPGISTLELDQFSEDGIRRAGAVPAFKGYRGYKATLCCSINQEVVHGIPSAKRKLVEGDIISLDIGLKKDGLFADMAVTIPIGRVKSEVLHFLEVSEQSLWAGIRQASPGNRLGDISHAVQRQAEKHGFSVVRDYVGHGVGRQLHEEPVLPNFGPAKTGPRLEVGMVLAIEPMVNMGGYAVRVLGDGWTVVTTDGSLSAHFEHSVAVTERGPLVLTNRSEA
ncbi:MAG: type I methionyl aminopeptidase [Candidatus Ozemobacteraceae bacterium]